MYFLCIRPMHDNEIITVFIVDVQLNTDILLPCLTTRTTVYILSFKYKLMFN